MVSQVMNVPANQPINASARSSQGIINRIAATNPRNSTAKNSPRVFSAFQMTFNRLEITPIIPNHDLTDYLLYIQQLIRRLRAAHACQPQVKHRKCSRFSSDQDDMDQSAAALVDWQLPKA